MPLCEPKYKRNIVIIKDYGGKSIRMSQHSVLRTKGIECPSEPPPPKGSVNDEKLDNNISRVKAKLYEYAYCNPWDYFVTFTIDPAKFDRHDLERYHKELAQWIRDYNKKHNLKLKYLFIPEQHKDGAWHEHGFIYGLPVSHLTAFEMENHLPNYILNKLANDEDIYNWEAYAEKFGYCIIEPVRNADAAAKYVTKYITKDLSRCVTDLNAHMYYCSKGLQRAQEVKRGILREDFTDIAPIDYENEYVRVAWLPNDENTMNRLLEAVQTECEIKQEGKNNDPASGNRGISNRPADSGEQPQDPEILQANTGAFLDFYRANIHKFKQYNASTMQEILYPPDNEEPFLDNDSNIHPGIEDILDMVLP